MWLIYLKKKTMLYFQNRDSPSPPPGSLPAPLDYERQYKHSVSNSSINSEGEFIPEPVSQGLTRYSMTNSPLQRVCLLILLCPRHDNGRDIKCYPCPSVLYVHTLRTYFTYILYVRMYVPIDVRSLTQIFFYQNFMKLIHIV